jgi:endonuclease/exonuclease/phosphatase (EEP) superfamily protein YafD
VSRVKTLILAGLIALPVFALAVRLAGLVSIRADIIAMLWPLFVAAGLVTLAGLSLLRSPRWWPARITALVLAIGLIAAATPWAWLRTSSQSLPASQAPAEAPSETLRLVTLNVWAGNTDPDAAGRFLADGDFDVIALQEVSGAAGPTLDRIETSHPNQVGCRWRVRLLTRLPVNDAGCVDEEVLPAAWLSTTLQGEPVTIVAVHLARPVNESRHRRQMEGLAAWLAARPEHNLVLMGDFNVSQGSVLMRDLEAELAPLERVTIARRTWPSRHLSPVPVIGIDHVWLGPGLCAGAVRVGPHVGSDHRPVMAAVHACKGQ